MGINWLFFLKRKLYEDSGLSLGVFSFLVASVRSRCGFCIGRARSEFIRRLNRPRFSCNLFIMKNRKFCRERESPTAQQFYLALVVNWNCSLFQLLWSFLALGFGLSSTVGRSGSEDSRKWGHFFFANYLFARQKFPKFFRWQSKHLLNKKMY